MKKFGVTIGLLALLVVGIGTSTVFADLVSLGASKDVKIRLRYPDTNFATTDNNLVVGDERVGGDKYANTLIQFDVASSGVTAGQVQSAEMKLYIFNAYNSTKVDVHRLRRAWVETEATYNQWKSGSAWTAPGGLDTANDIGSTVYDTLTTVSDQTGWVTFDVTALVKKWLDGTYDNDGMNLVYGGPDTNCNVGFYSSNYTDDESLRPKLDITYVPEPATIGLMLMGIVGLIRRR